MAKATFLECSLCHRHYEAGKPANLCECGGPLLVRYDLESLREKLRDALALRGCQRIVPLSPHRSAEQATEEFEVPGLPHDGIEPMRRMVRWVIDQSV